MLYFETMNRKTVYRIPALLALLTLPVIAASCGPVPKPTTSRPKSPRMVRDVPAPLCRWPWPDAKSEMLRVGVTHWQVTSGDGTRLELLKFDFVANPRLRLEIFDQDQDDEKPFDNRARFWERGVGQITRQLNREGKGPVIAAWNGLFFGYDQNNANGIAEHVSPVVLNGATHYNSGSHRWTFGVKYRHRKPTFKTLHLPKKKILADEFDWAAGAAQCLILKGKPLRLEPFPLSLDTLKIGPVPSTPQEAGHIPTVDHMRTSRVSLGWSPDSQTLYLLFVKEPGNETASALAFRHGEIGVGGWTLYDLQRFWIAKGVWGAINSDGGNVAQMAYLQVDSRYTLITENSRKIVTPAFEDAPEGGALMYFYIRESQWQGGRP